MDTNGWSPLRHQDMVTCSARLSLLFATCSQQKLPETRTTESEKKAKTQGSVLKQWVLPAKEHAIRESEPRHLNELVCDAQTRCTFIADVRHCVHVAYTCTLVLRCRLFSTALRCLAAIWHRVYTSGVQ